MLATAALAASQGTGTLSLVKLTGIVLGALLLFAAIRAMFGKRK